MKFILTADNHLTASRPEWRTDNYGETGLGKLEFILDTARARQAPVLCAGDLFDKASGPLWYLNKVLELILLSNVPFMAVAGNHDQHFHNPDIAKTQLGNAIVAAAIRELREEEFWGNNNLEEIIHGRSWNEPYLEPPDAPDACKILVAHATVTKEMPPPWLTAQSAEEFIDAHPGYDLIVTGDFHEKFLVTKGGTTLVNTGPMMRSSIDKRDFQPSIWEYDTITRKVTEIPIPVKADVFDMAALEKAAAIKGEAFSSELMSKFLGTLDFGDERPSFSQIVRSSLEAMGADKADLKSEIEEIMDHVQAKN